MKRLASLRSRCFHQSDSIITLHCHMLLTQIHPALILIMTKLNSLPLCCTISVLTLSLFTTTKSNEDAFSAFFIKTISCSMHGTVSHLGPLHTTITSYQVHNDPWFYANRIILTAMTLQCHSRANSPVLFDQSWHQVALGVFFYRAACLIQGTSGVMGWLINMGLIGPYQFSCLTFQQLVSMRHGQ